MIEDDNKTHPLEVQSTKAESTLNEIQQLAKRSTSFRPYYVDIAESVAGKFVAAILFIASLTFLFWAWLDGFDNLSNAMSHTISVLIVTCPCALALAAPVALSLGAAGLNRLHLLAVKMSSIEKLNHVDTIVFDKTGTLTTGEPVVRTIKALGALSIEEYIQIVTIMERGSHHPFAKAIFKYQDEQFNDTNHRKKGGVDINTTEKQPIFEPKSVKQFTGQGVEAIFSGVAWRLGNEQFTKCFNTSESNGDQSFASPETLKEINDWREQGYSVLYLANEEHLQAVFCIVDPLRKGIDTFLKQVKQLGIKRQIILSGDHQQSVAAIAKQLGITEAHGGMSPQDKLNWVRELQEQSSQKIMMLGDGINDAPTLAVADISLTFSEATDLAKNNCDFIILGKDYTHLGKAFQLMQNIRSIILQNLGWAIAYNVIAIPLAAIGLITPWMAAIGMSVSSLVVVLNSLRLKNYSL
jgi:Cu2+-exporting ATPase